MPQQKYEIIAEEIRERQITPFWLPERSSRGNNHLAHGQCRRAAPTAAVENYAGIECQRLVVFWSGDVSCVYACMLVHFYACRYVTAETLANESNVPSCGRARI